MTDNNPSSQTNVASVINDTSSTDSSSTVSLVTDGASVSEPPVPSLLSFNQSTVNKLDECYNNACSFYSYC